MALKIALVSSTFPPYQGGMGNAAAGIAQGLGRRGHAVTILLPDRRAYHGAEIGSAPYERRFIQPLFSVGNASFVPAMLSALEGFDLMHLFYPYFGGDVVVGLASRRYQIPYVIHYHQDVVGDTLWKQLLFNGYNILVQPRLFHGAARILALSDDHIRHSKVVRHLRSWANVVIIPNGVDPETFSPAVTTRGIRERYRIHPERPLLIFVGALDAAHYFKRLDLLLQALPMLRQSAHLLVVGDGDRRPLYEAMARTLGIERRVTFAGLVPNRDLAPYLHESDVLVLPSSDTESFGIVLIEALACGTPVVASDLAGVRATVDDGVTGLLFRRGDVGDLVSKLDRLIADPALRHSFGQRGVTAVRARYSWDSVAQRLEGVYAAVLAERSRGLQL